MMVEKRIIIGSDHAGYRLKMLIKEHVESFGYDVEDVGCYTEESCDYPVIGHEVARKVREQDVRGILICGTGLGMSMVANRRPGIRAALCHDAYTAEMSRKHNNANILVFGGRVIGESVALNMTDVWLSADFEGSRHSRRLDMIDE